MEFRQSIKQLEKQYYDILKQYYSTSKLILKMIAMHNSSELSEPDICFKTCDMYSFSDKYIEKLRGTNIEKAVQNLRVRGVCCIYTAQAIDNIIMNTTRFDEKGVKFVQDLKDIKEQLYDLGQTSINKSNSFAKSYRLPYMTIDENLILRHHENYDRGYYDEEYCDIEMLNIDKFK